MSASMTPTDAGSIVAISPFREAFSVERKLFRAERLVPLVVAILLCAILYGIANGVAWRDRQSALLTSARAEEQTRLTEQREKLAGMQDGTYKPTSAFQNPRDPLWVGLRHAATYAALPLSPLAVTAIGQSDLNPPYVLVSADTRETFALNDEIENPGNLLAGRFDLAFFIVFLLPLIIVALSYNVLSSEREQGTLAMLASNPVRMAVLMWAKLAFRAVLVLVPLVVFTLAAMMFMGVPLTAGDVLARLLAWVLMVSAYVGFWFAVAAAVASLGKGSAQNALILVTAWVLLVLVIPTFGSVYVNLAYPVPSRAEMINTLREVKADSAREADINAARYAIEHESDKNGGVASDKDYQTASQRVTMVKLAADKIAATMGVYDRQIARQRESIALLRYLSPALLLQESLNEIAGTSDLRYADFAAQVNRFHLEWQQYFHDKVLANEPLDAADFDRFPRFEYREASIGLLVPALVPAWLGLLLPMGFLLGWAGRRMRNYPVDSR